MIHYDPVEFYGTIHPKSSGHSFARFQELQLHKGDVIDVEYVNDVMPYVSKPYNDYNIENAKVSPLELFPQVCPICGTPIIISDSGKSAKCPNPSCGGRQLARMINTCAKLNMNGFGEATIQSMGIYHIWEIIDLFINHNYIEILTNKGFGPGEISNMKSEIDRLLQTPLLETQMLGSLGFDNVSTRTWELVLSKIEFEQFKGLYYNISHKDLKNIIKQIKGIGPATADIIVDEYSFFEKDIEYFERYGTLKYYEPIIGKKIRASGFRDELLFASLRNLGLDADDNASVTKDTDILLVMDENSRSSKIDKANKYGVQIVSVKDFVENMDKYL